MGVLDIYRHEADGSISWFACAHSMKIARLLIRANAASPSDEFLIRDYQSNESIILRADGYWFQGSVETKQLPPVSQISPTPSNYP